MRARRRYNKSIADSINVIIAKENLHVFHGDIFYIWERATVYKTCGRCGQIHPKNFTCNKNRPVVTKTAEAKIRARNKWRLKSLEIRARANNLCEVCRAQGQYIYNDLEVHHITKLSEDMTKWLDDDNLICLCTQCHKKADRGDIDKEYLRQLARARG